MEFVMERGQKSAEIFISPTESRLEAGAGIEPGKMPLANDLFKRLRWF
jgi:hypothetical protein